MQQLLHLSCSRSLFFEFCATERSPDRTGLPGTANATSKTQSGQLRSTPTATLLPCRRADVAPPKTPRHAHHRHRPPFPSPMVLQRCRPETPGHTRHRPFSPPLPTQKHADSALARRRRCPPSATTMSMMPTPTRKWRNGKRRHRRGIFFNHQTKIQKRETKEIKKGKIGKYTRIRPV